MRHTLTPTACVAILLFSAGSVSASGEVVPVAVRGRALAVAHVPSWAPERRASVLFLPGDGGWRGFAVTIANRMAAAGYDVFALDTRDYLEAFTGGHALTVNQVAADLGTIASAIRRRGLTPIELVGWSEGAALVIAAAARGPASFGGVIAFGVPEQGTLGWRLRDSIASLAGREPDEPQFEVAPLLDQLTATPLVMIQATHDPFTTQERAQLLFGRVRAPKRLAFIDARNHRFDGGTERFFAALLDGLQWLLRGSTPPSMPRGRAQ